MQPFTHNICLIYLDDRLLVHQEATKGVQRALISLDELKNFVNGIKKQPLSIILVDECDAQVHQLEDTLRLKFIK
jgi:hypothetical protein